MANGFSTPEDVADVLHGLAAALRFQADVCPHPWAKKHIEAAWREAMIAEEQLRNEARG